MNVLFPIVFALGVCTSMISSQLGVCTITVSTSQIYYTYEQVGHTTYYGCGFWDFWSRCPRTSYSKRLTQRSRVVYHIETICCVGYSGDGIHCSPICANCTGPHLCVVHNVCACPTEWTGDDCTDPPQDVSLVATGFDSLEISWEPPTTSSEEANTTLYIVLCEFEVANETYVIVPEDNRIIELDSLTPHTNYTCCVVANTTLGPSRQACVTQTTLESVPADPTGNVNVTAINSTAIKVEWSPSQTPNGIIDHYTIYINAAPVLNISATNGNQKAVVGGLSPNQQINVSISASTKIGEGPVSTEENATTHESVPGAVQNMEVVVLSENLFHVTWEPPLSPNGAITGYQVVVTDLIITRESHYSMLPYSLQLNISYGIEPYIPYDVSVSATTSIGAGESVRVIIFTLEGVPQNVPLYTSILRTEATSTSIEWDELSWEDLRGEFVSYEFGYDSVRTGDTQCPVSDSYYNDTLPVVEERYVITDLHPGLQYCVRVAAKTSAGVGPFNHSLIPWYKNNEFTVVLERKNCTQWIVTKLLEKMEDLAREISRGIEQFCSCKFPSDYITDGRLTCDETHPDLVLFQGRLISTNDRDSSDLAKDLEKWVSNKPTVVVQGERVPVVSSDTTSSSKQQEDSSLSETAVGAIVGIITLLVLLVATLTITLVACYRCKRRSSLSVTVANLSDSYKEKTTEFDRYSSNKLTTADYEEPCKSTKQMELATKEQPVYKKPADEGENIYDNPDKALASTSSTDIPLCNCTYEDTVAEPGAASGVDEGEVYCEMQANHEDEENTDEDS